jgi:pimeloyl-ACP methyl ester carboxylesterase
MGQRMLRGALAHFDIIEHTVRAQYTRHYLRGAEVGAHSSLRLAVKQYVPKKPRIHSQVQLLTVIGAHGNGLPKELLEPLWDDLHERLDPSRHAIKSIWVADQAHQGQSGVINEGLLGNDPSGFDHARDLLFLINQMQDEMPQPLFGVGHSIGAAHLMHLALLHPRLLQGLVLLDPVLQLENPGIPFGRASTYRRDLWPSREEARKSFLKNPIYGSWESRVFEKWMEVGLRQTPTELYPGSPGSHNQVTLTTPKSQEVFSFLRPLYNGQAGVPPEEDVVHYNDLDRSTYQPGDQFYKPEPAILFRQLPAVKPPVQFVFGKKSTLNSFDEQRTLRQATGSGRGGSGGIDYGYVREHALDCGHFVPMEDPQGTAQITAHFVEDEASKWREAQDTSRKQWHSMPRPQRVSIDDQWRTAIGPKTSTVPK